MRNLYSPLISKGAKFLSVNRRAAELIKYASNAFLATKITFINEIANLCEKAQIDVEDISIGIGLDKRIGSRFLRAGPAYGGSCFPKDTKAIVNTADKFKVNLSVIKSVINSNSLRSKILLEKVNEILNKTNVEVIAQNLTSSNSSSDTGGITAVNLRNLNVNRSIIAHSEARIRQKNPQDVLNEIIPMGFQFVLCFEEIDQIPLDLLTNDFEIILAYEPVWAIGTGETASIDHINEIHEQVKSKLKDLELNIPVLYGGSVNPSNSKDILESEFVDGVLVGGASTKIDKLEGILNSI